MSFFSWIVLDYLFGQLTAPSNKLSLYLELVELLVDLVERFEIFCRRQLALRRLGMVICSTVKICRLANFQGWLVIKWSISVLPIAATLVDTSRPTKALARAWSRARGIEQNNRFAIEPGLHRPLRDLAQHQITQKSTSRLHHRACPVGSQCQEAVLEFLRGDDVLANVGDDLTCSRGGCRFFSPQPARRAPARPTTIT